MFYQIIHSQMTYKLQHVLKDQIWLLEGWIRANKKLWNWALNLNGNEENAQTKTYQLTCDCMYLEKILGTYKSLMNQTYCKTDTEKSKTTQNCAIYLGCFQHLELKF